MSIDDDSDETIRRSRENANKLWAVGVLRGHLKYAQEPAYRPPANLVQDALVILALQAVKEKTVL